MNTVTSFLSKLTQYSTSFPIILIQKIIIALLIFVAFYGLAIIFYRITLAILKKHKTRKYHVLRLIGTLVKIFIIILVSSILIFNVLFGYWLVKGAYEVKLFKNVKTNWRVCPFDNYYCYWHYKTKLCRFNKDCTSKSVTGLC